MMRDFSALLRMFSSSNTTLCSSRSIKSTEELVFSKNSFPPLVKPDGIRVLYDGTKTNLDSLRDSGSDLDLSRLVFPVSGKDAGASGGVGKIVGI